MGNKELLIQKRTKLMEELDSVRKWIVRHHGPEPEHSFWDDDIFEVVVKKELVGVITNLLNQTEEEIEEFNRRERGEVHPLTVVWNRYRFERNVVKWGTLGHKNGMKLPTKTLRVRVQEITNKLIEIPEIYFPTFEKSIQLRYSYGDYLLLIDFFENQTVQLAVVHRTYDDFRNLGFLPKITSFEMVSCEKIEAINSMIISFYETDWAKSLEGWNILK